MAVKANAWKMTFYKLKCKKLFRKLNWKVCWSSFNFSQWAEENLVRAKFWQFYIFRHEFSRKLCNVFGQSSNMNGAAPSQLQYSIVIGEGWAVKRCSSSNLYWTDGSGSDPYVSHNLIYKNDTMGTFKELFTFTVPKAFEVSVIH
jgi:hypothetical protein